MTHQDWMERGQAKRVALEALRVNRRFAVSARFLSSLKVNQRNDFIGDRAIEFAAEVFAQRDTRTVTEAEAVPADWWQAFRERWFPAWWLRKHPAKRRTIEKRVEHQYIRICPHMPDVERGGDGCYHFLTCPPAGPPIFNFRRDEP